MRIHGLLTGVGLCALSVASARAEVVEVAAEADIQAAINGAAAGDVVHLQGTEYRISQELTLSNGITLLGADDASSVVITNTSGSSRVITIGHPDAVVSGVTLTGGVAADNGGGVYMTAGLLTNCVVRGNRISANEKNGCGVCIYPSDVADARVVGCVISDNGTSGKFLAYGAGVGGPYVKQTQNLIKPEVVNCVIANNFASGNNSRGVGACDVTLKDCIIEGNENSGQNSYGGGMANCVAYRCIVRNNRVVGQSNTGMGAGARESDCYDCLFTGNYNNGQANTYNGTVQAGNYYNCTIVGNTCRSGSSAGVGKTTAATTLYNCIVADNYVENTETLANYIPGSEPTCYNTAISPIGLDSPLRDGGNSDADPKLNADFTLGASWCVDAGDDTEVGDDRLVDLAGNPRKVGDHVDLGCYEKQSVVDGELAVSIDADVVTASAGTLTTFAATVVAPLGAEVALIWDFGDGSGVEEASCTGTGAALQVERTHAYAVGGAFDLKVTASVGLGEPVVALVAEKVRVQVDGGLFVSPNGSDTDNGLSALTPKKTLRCAAKAAKPGATITLLAGTHEVKEEVVVDGGVLILANPGAVFSGTGFSDIVLNDGSALKNLVFDNVTASDSLVKMEKGTVQDCVFKDVSLGNSTQLIYIKDLQNTCLVDRCCFEDVVCGFICRPDTARDKYIFRDCEFTGCDIKQYGVQKCYVYRGVFTDNTVVNALTIDCNVYDSLYLRNRMTDGANAGIIRNGTSVNCTLAFNTSQAANKSAILLRQGKHYNDLFFCNTNQNGSAMTICVFKDNESERASYAPTLYNCWGETGLFNADYCTVAGPCLTGTDPLIKDDGRLKHGSACIDAGNMDYYTSSYKSDLRTHDVLGNLRVKNASSVIDIGCVEYVGLGLKFIIR